MTMRLVNASAIAEFYGRVGLILHVITRSRMIDIHGREGRHRVNAAMATICFKPFYQNLPPAVSLELLGMHTWLHIEEYLSGKRD
jgi:hypothetical protein